MDGFRCFKTSRLFAEFGMIFVKELVKAIFTLWLAATLVFFALRILPGDAVTAQLSLAGSTEAQIQQRRADLGLNDPIMLQYIHFLIRAGQGDLGVSLTSGQQVTDLILAQWPYTVQLAMAAMVVAIFFGFSAGAAAVTRTPFGMLVRWIIHLSISMPVYWTATLCIYLFAVVLGVLPAAGGETLEHLILPVSILGFHSGGAIARLVAMGLSSVNEATFVLAAHARGLHQRQVFWRHMLPVVLPSVIAFIAVQMGFLLSGVVFTESIFVRPGIGQLTLRAVLDQDYPVVQGVVLFSAGIYVILTLLSDILQRLLDPRIADVSRWS